MAPKTARSEPEAKRSESEPRADEARGARMRGAAACEQTSMQLSVQAPAGGPQALQIKDVELFDESGASLGKLTPRSPTIWSEDGTYKDWDQMVVPATSQAVSYALSAPNWSKIPGRYNTTFVLKVLVTVGAKDQTIKKDVRIAAPTIMSPNIRT